MNNSISDDLREKVLAAAKNGEVVDLTDESDRDIPAAFLLPLLTGTQPDLVAHNRGIHFVGARIVGEFDFSFSTFAVPLALENCEIIEPVNLSGVTAPFISLKGSNVRQLNFDHLELRTDLVLTGVDLQSLDEDQYALSADNAHIGGSLLLDERFCAKGEVRLMGAVITGQLDCSGGTFENENGYALNADGVRVWGDLILEEKFCAKGEVRFLGADIAGQLNCLVESLKMRIERP